MKFNGLGEGHEKDDTKNFDKTRSHNHLVCTGSCLLSNFIEKLLKGPVYFFPILPCLSSNPLETLPDTINLILHPGHVDFIMQRETRSLQWAFIIGILSGAWALCRRFS